MRILALTLACSLPLLGVASAASSQVAGRKAQPAAAERNWSAAGGTVEVRWNRELLGELGISVSTLGDARRLGMEGERFALDRASVLRFRAKDGYFREGTDGALRAQGGYVLKVGKFTMPLDDFKLVPSGAGFALIGADGQAWLRVDRVMHELARRDAALSIASSDIRITPALARRLGRPFLSGWTIGQLRVDAEVAAPGSGSNFTLASTIKWHGEAAPNGNIYQNDLFMQQITAQYLRCNGCSGENGSGDVVITPASTLKNNVNQGSISATIPGDARGTSRALYTASIPWYSKFTGNFAPYGNDQHPYLIWNMYRLNADGSIEQIGRSGVKQAFLTINQNCLDEPDLDHNSHVLGRGCADVYSTSNNDNNNSLSPRWEILPASGRWGRCGSTFDTNCDGASNPSPAPNNYYQRMVVDESQIAPSRNPGASWLFDSWYLARQDIDIFNSMSSVVTTQAWTGSVWNVTYGPQKLGPVIDRWVAPPQVGQAALVLAGVSGSARMRAPGRAARGGLQEMEWSQPLTLNEADGSVGHATLAVRARELPGGQWQYHYAVMNFDITFWKTTGSEPNLRITSNRGFERFEVLTTARVTTPVFRDGDLDSANDWQLVNGRGTRGWSLGSVETNHLFWGTLFSYSFTSSAPPRYGQAELSTTAGDVFNVATLVPGA